MKLLSSLLLLLSISFSAAALENDQAKTWLERLSHSLQTLNFATSFVVVKNNQAEPYHWFHGVDEENKELEEIQNKQIKWAVFLMIAMILIIIGVPFINNNFINKFEFKLKER